MPNDLVERAAKAMAEADLWPGAWDGNMPDGYAMSDAEKNAWTHRAEAALAAVAPLIAQAEREACAEISFNEYLAASHDDEDPENHDLVARFRSQGGADSASRIRDAIRARGGEG